MPWLILKGLLFAATTKRGRALLSAGGRRASEFAHSDRGQELHAKAHRAAADPVVRERATKAFRTVAARVKP